jgi:opacity protein-like surface antigen
MTRSAPALVVAVLILSFVALAGVCDAEDTDQVRYYLSTRVGVIFSPSGGSMSGLELSTYTVQSTGLSLGVNFHRYLGAELAVDGWDVDVKVPGLGSIGEYGVASVLAQARLRYPLLDNTLTPYVLGGLGVMSNEFNDRKPRGVGMSIQAEGTTFAGAVGAGIEYFVANNVALGVEARYVVSRDQEFTINGRRQSANLDTMVVAGSLRLLFPETPEVAAAAPAEIDTTGRFYFGLRAGGAAIPHRRMMAGLEAKPLNSAIAGTLDPLYGVGLGWDITRFVGFELSGHGYETALRIPGLGSIGEYGLYELLPEVRVRYPLLHGRLLPFLLAGVGISYGEFNDRTPHGNSVAISAKDYAILGAAGVGFEYFVAQNMAAGIETKYEISRGHEFTIPGDRGHANLDAILTMVGVRIYFGEQAGRGSRGH